MGALIIGIGKRKGAPSMPPPESDNAPSKASKPSSDDGSDDSDGGKMSAEEAGVVRSDHHCKDCKQYQAQSGNCRKVAGVYEPEDACWRWFTPMSGGDQGGDYEEQAEDGSGSPSEEAAEGENQ